MDRGQINPLALGLVIVGPAALALAAFLPLDEAAGPFGRVEQNTLIQHGGWQLIVLAIAIAAAGFRASQHRDQARVGAIILCVLAAIRTIAWATDKDLRTLYPVGPGGALDTSHPGTVVDLGIAIYVAGFGLALASVGSLMFFQRGRHEADDALIAAWREKKEAEKKPTTKKCPDCAETILAAAKVCKHCGYRFATAARSASPQQPATAKGAAPAVGAKSSKVRCHHCRHEWSVPLSQNKFDCENCGKNLQRRSSSNA